MQLNVTFSKNTSNIWCNRIGRSDFLCFGQIGIHITKWVFTTVAFWPPFGINTNQFPKPQSITASNKAISSCAVHPGSSTGKSDVCMKKWRGEELSVSWVYMLKQSVWKRLIQQIQFILLTMISYLWSLSCFLYSNPLVKHWNKPSKLNFKQTLHWLSITCYKTTVKSQWNRVFNVVIIL